MSCWAAMAVSHWDSFQEEAERPSAEERPCPHLAQQLSPSMPQEAQPTLPWFSPIPGSCLGRAGCLSWDGVDRVRSPGIAGPCPHCSFWYPVRVPGLNVQMGKLRPERWSDMFQITQVVSRKTNAKQLCLGALFPLHSGCGPALFVAAGD